MLTHCSQTPLNLKSEIPKWSQQPIHEQSGLEAGSVGVASWVLTAVVGRCKVFPCSRYSYSSSPSGGQLVDDVTVPKCAKCLEHNSTNLNRTVTRGRARFRPVLDSSMRDRIRNELFGPLIRSHCQRKNCFLWDSYSCRQRPPAVVSPTSSYS